MQFLRAFRDQSVESTFAGSAFMKAFNTFYYSFSPAVAATMMQSPVLQEAVKLLLYPLVAALRSASAVFNALAIAPELAVAVSGVVASTLIGVMYLAPLAMIACLRSKKGRGRH